MSDKSWHKLLINGPAALEEPIAATVAELTGNGVEITGKDGAAGNPLVIGYLSADDPVLADKLAAIRYYLRELATEFHQLPEATLELELLADRDWHQQWKERLKPFHLSKSMVVKPSWENYQPAANEKIIEIDPGMAFGTGLHASTRLAMELMEEHIGELPTPPAGTLDVGTGTGILAIGAALFGCERITAIDNDPEAVTTARDNINANGLTDRIEVGDIDLNDLVGPYDLILANIIHNTLVEMAPVLARLLAPEGILILAGILQGEQSANISSIYDKQGLTKHTERSSGEWSALSFIKKNR